MMRSRDQLRRDQARLVSRVGGACTLRCMMTLAALLDHDYALATIYLAILQASLAELEDNPELAKRYAGIDEVPPDNLRRPISVHALAQSLHMPYETTRRGVGRLIRLGFVIRVSRSGVLASAAREAEPEGRRVAEQDYTDVIKMIAQLQRHGVDVSQP